MDSAFIDPSTPDRSSWLHAAGKAYEAGGAIRRPEWAASRIDFKPWPYPSATKLIVEAMGHTMVEGDATFLRRLDPDFVARDLVDDRFVRASLKRYPEWPGANDGSAPIRQETLRLRLDVSWLVPEAAQSAMLQFGARGSLEGADAFRRLREAQFVAIVTPSSTHIIAELARGA